ncbi:uncharacterized protein LOC106878922 isoform X14 [Octopus bimaculoides]|uniref:uncharacterized protein LOC106878922 isoform X14 n=1 Tax=Octopus bimaculoides TaxID=37653 RepID=UPI00071CAE69|nr:uncharacterized protein LOC106878922 isoform X14 [Octopus bimaculoides]|eukprot:XP_014783770.1 PREDICTED: protein couch potato-like isoform X12 [Octopus bimaculoides]
MRSNEMTAHTSPSLNTETSISLSQSMDSVNTTPEEELSTLTTRGQFETEENLTSTETSPTVRTLFVSGLPMDAKPRELYLLFRAYKPVGFVTFNSRVEAEAAKQDLQGVKFDPDLPQTLRLEFAKSNTKVTKPKQQSPQPAATHPTIIHPLTGQELGAAFFPGSPEAWTPHPLAYPELAPATATAIHHAALIQHPALAQVPVRHAFQETVFSSMFQNVNPNYQKILVPENTHRINTSLSDTGYPKYIGSMIPNQIHPTSMIAHPSTVQATVPHPQIAATPILTSPVGTNSTTPSQPNAPCSTLFVANLGQFSSEQELKDLFSSFPGFCRLRMHNKGGSPVAFVEFQDVRQATEAMNRLHGFVLLSSDRGGIRIEYAKNKMGEVLMPSVCWMKPVTSTTSIETRKEDVPATGQSPVQAAAY